MSIRRETHPQSPEHFVIQMCSDIVTITGCFLACRIFICSVKITGLLRVFGAGKGGGGWQRLRFLFKWRLSFGFLHRVVYFVPKCQRTYCPQLQGNNWCRWMMNRLGGRTCRLPRKFRGNLVSHSYEGWKYFYKLASCSIRFQDVTLVVTLRISASSSEHVYYYIWIGKAVCSSVCRILSLSRNNLILFLWLLRACLICNA